MKDGGRSQLLDCPILESNEQNITLPVLFTASNGRVTRQSYAQTRGVLAAWTNGKDRAVVVKEDKDCIRRTVATRRENKIFKHTEIYVSLHTVIASDSISTEPKDEIEIDSSLQGHAHNATANSNPRKLRAVDILISAEIIHCEALREFHGSARHYVEIIMHPASHFK